MCELARIASHLIWYGTTALDLGATTPFVYAWREREKILDINELVSGVRMHTSFIRVGGLLADVPDEFYGMVEEVAKTFPHHIDEYETLITGNEIFRERTRGLGVISAADAINYGVTGPSLRGSGVRLRPAQGAALQLLRPLPTSTSRSASTATSTTATWCGCRRCASRSGSSTRRWPASPAAR